MPGYVVGDEGGYEVVGMVVAGLHAQLYFMTFLLTDCFQQLWLELFFQKVVSGALVHQ